MHILAVNSSSPLFTHSQKLKEWTHQRKTWRDRPPLNHVLWRVWACPVPPVHWNQCPRPFPQCPFDMLPSMANHSRPLERQLHHYPRVLLVWPFTNVYKTSLGLWCISHESVAPMRYESWTITTTFAQHVAINNQPFWNFGTATMSTSMQLHCFLVPKCIDNMNMCHPDPLHLCIWTNVPDHPHNIYSTC